MAVASFSNKISNTYVEGWCDTKVNIVSTSFIWTINNFSYCFDKMEGYIESPFFNTPVNNRKWRMRLRDDWRINVFLKRASNDYNDFRATHKISFINSKNEKVHQIKKKIEWSVFLRNNDWDLWNEKGRTVCTLNNEILKDVLINDKLTLYCEISMTTDIVNFIEFKKSENNISENLKKLFENKKFSDITFNVQGREFKAHKVILAAHSQVFSAMFEHEMEEKRQNGVEIIDVKPEVFQEMLDFIYTGKAPNLNKKASDLLAVADKYALEELKIICEQELFSKLST